MRRSIGPGLVAAAAVAVAAFLVVPRLVLSAPIEPVMGLVQKIFYFHVPCATMMFLSTFTAAAGSLAFLFRGSNGGDRLAHAAAELGVLFGACTLVTGPLWGRKAWGVWWQWDARLTSSLLLFLILIGYLLARRYAGPGGRKLAAALALFAAVDVPLVYKSVDFWRTIHPQTSVVPTLDPKMRPAFWASFALITLVWGILLSLRMRLESARTELAELQLLAEDELVDGSANGDINDAGTGEAPLRLARGPARAGARAAALGAAAVALGTALWPAAAVAQEFVKVNEAAREQIPSVPFVGAAYGFIWAAILVYVVVVARGVARVRREIDDVRRRVESAVSAGQGAGGPPASR